MNAEVKIKEFLGNLDSFSNNKLKFKEDLEKILIIAEKENKISLILDLSFFSKFTWKTLNLLKKNIPDSDKHIKIQNEFNIHIKKITELLKQILADQDQTLKTHFEKKFLNEDSSSFQNLLEIIYDFSWIKNWCLEHNDKMWT